MNGEKKKTSNVVIIIIILSVLGVFGLCFIGLLAAIAIPNFLEAQVRSKVARSKADFRSLSTALETYYLDNNVYPPNPKMDGDYSWLTRLNTPIQYVSTDEIYDVFASPPERVRYFAFENASGYPSDFPSYIVYGAGPDTDHDLTLNANGQFTGINTLDDLVNMEYDSSNGTISNGDIIRFMFHGDS